MNLNLFIILIILVNKVVYGQNFNFIPGPRTLQAAVHVGDKIYYIGGQEFAPFSHSNFFYLETDKTWVDLASQGVNLPLTAVGHTADIGGINQDLIFIIGGEQNTVHQFDTKTNTLTTPIIQGKMPPIRGIMNSVSYEGKIYMFGGYEPNNVIYNGFDILDTINLSWGIGNLEG